MTLRLACALRLGVALAVLGAVSPVLAQRVDRSFNPQLFHPAVGPDEFITVEPGGVLGHLQYEVGLYLNYARNEFTIYQFDNNTKQTSSPLANLIANRL